VTNLTPERLDVLQTYWARFLVSQQLPLGVGYELFDDLVARYGEPHRHYHSLEHIAEVLKLLGKLARGLDGPAIWWAAWYHDAVYDPKRSDNERASADYAETCLKSIGLSELTATVTELILATAHASPPATIEANVLVDADLAILGSSERRYDRYAAAIRQEYAHVHEDAYKQGRIAVLERFLARPAIYRTALLQETGEAAARANMRREIDALR
jgi:predicted metal-dependent HD superfamily phosphohydrolase